MKKLFYASLIGLLVIGCNDKTDILLAEKNIAENTPTVVYNYNSNGKVYILGNVKESSASPNYGNYGCWVDGVWTALPYVGDLRSIYFNGNDLYVAGTKKLQNGLTCAFYWKNGQEVKLGDDVQHSDVTDIAFSNGKVYVCGSESGTTYKGIIWENGERKYMKENAYFTKMKILDGNIYVSGYSYSQEKGGAVAKVWKNNQELNTPTDDFYKLVDLEITGSDKIYLGNKVNTQSFFYWKNGQRTLLEQSTYYGMYAGSIYVSDKNNVLASGAVAINSPYTLFAAVWRNGVLDVIDNTPNSNAKGIAEVDGKELIIGNAPIKNASGIEESRAYIWVDGAKQELTRPADKPIASAMQFYIKK